MTRTDIDGPFDDSEEAPFLREQPNSKTPVPWRQLTPVFAALIAEPISFAYIFPFINQLIGELSITGGDSRKIGYYAGLIESLFYLTQGLTAWQWSRLSDFVGRRPVILIGLLGASVSNLAFGLSRTLVALVISRCIAGILNGNNGVMKSMLGDITDHTNTAQVFAFTPLLFLTGVIIAPLFGGVLAKPQEQWPLVFQAEFWATHPYFLPSLVAGSFTLLAFLICVIFMKESLPSKTSGQPPSVMFAVEGPPGSLPMGDAQPLPMSTLLKIHSVIIPIANYGMLAFVEISLLLLLPLFYASPIEIGGLGLPPHIIGTFQAVYGIVNGIIQASSAAKLIEWVGAKRVYRWAVTCFYPLIFLFPTMSAIVAIEEKVGPMIWILLVTQLVLMAFMDLSFTAIFIFITRSAPNERSLGSVNGLGQSLASFARAIGPALTTSLFAASKEYNLLGGNLVYVFLTIPATVLVVLSYRLPELKDVDEKETYPTKSEDDVPVA